MPWETDGQTGISKMAVRGAAANSLLLKRGFDRRKEEELFRIFKAADTNQVRSWLGQSIILAC